MRRLLPAVAVAALLAPAGALADVQQVLLPGPTPYPTPSPQLATGGAPPWATLTFKIHATTDQRVGTGVDSRGRVVSVRALERLHLTGTGDYLIVVSAPDINRLRKRTPHRGAVRILFWAAWKSSGEKFFHAI